MLNKRKQNNYKIMEKYKTRNVWKKNQGQEKIILFKNNS